MTTKIAIIGAGGRMGGRLIALAQADANLKLVAAIVRTGSPMIGGDAGLGLPMSVDWIQRPDVVVDFSTPDSTRQQLRRCREQRIPMLIGTTGLTPADHAAIDDASVSIPVLQASNTSLGVTVLLQLIRDAARLLDERFDVEIVEAHHRLKKDAPSGTALSIADAVLKARGKTRDDLKVGRNETDGPRAVGEIGMHSLRLGDEVGRHTVSFATVGERIELTHAATSRDTFAAGALAAAKWLALQPPGRYSMADMLASARET